MENSNQAILINKENLTDIVSELSILTTTLDDKLSGEMIQELKALVSEFENNQYVCENILEKFNNLNKDLFAVDKVIQKKKNSLIDNENEFKKIIDNSLDKIQKEIERLEKKTLFESSSLLSKFDDTQKEYQNAIEEKLEENLNFTEDKFLKYYRLLAEIDSKFSFSYKKNKKIINYANMAIGVGVGVVVGVLGTFFMLSSHLVR